MRTSWPSFHLETVPERDVVRVTPVGEVDLATVGVIRKELRQLEQVGFMRLVLDLRSTTFLDSTGLHLILEEVEAARAAGAQFAIVEGPPEVQRVFELTGVGAQLPFSDVAELTSGAAWA